MRSSPTGGTSSARAVGGARKSAMATSVTKAASAVARITADQESFDNFRMKRDYTVCRSSRHNDLREAARSRAPSLQSSICSNHREEAT
jgi:hypothetical protein